MYVFSKKIKLAEVSSLGNGYTTTIGYTTVTHSNFIHLLCHQNAYKADANNRQPKKEWDGASIRNDHTKCNNLFPLNGGKITEDSYSSVVERYFQVLQKSLGQSDSDKVKVLLHDFKFLLIGCASASVICTLLSSSLITLKIVRVFLPYVAL